MVRRGTLQSLHHTVSVRCNPHYDVQWVLVKTIFVGTVCMQAGGHRTDDPKRQLFHHCSRKQGPEPTKHWYVNALIPLLNCCYG
jgi:hypothetical protein